MSKQFDNALVYRVAKYNYIDNLPQVEIARIEGISRSKVARILEKARASGIVTIDIKVPGSEISDDIEKKLLECLPLNGATVVPASVNESTDDTDDQLIIDVASVAAAILHEELKDKKHIGVGWGRTIYHLPNYLPFIESNRERVVVPLVGNMSFRNRYLQTSNNVCRFGEKLDAQTYYLNISCMRGKYEGFSAAEQYNISQIRQYWDTLDAAIFSLGAAPLENYVYLETEMSADQFTIFDKDPEAQGEILSQVYFSDKERTAQPIGKDAVVVAMPLEKLRDVPYTLLVAAGNYKAEPLYYAVMNGYAKNIVIDHMLAEELLKICEEKKNA